MEVRTQRNGVVDEWAPADQTRKRDKLILRETVTAAAGTGVSLHVSGVGKIKDFMVRPA